jgi:hypothetical protein
MSRPNPPLRTSGVGFLGIIPAEARKLIDAEAAATILADLLDRCHNRKP